ncbi:hypothetical protein [Bacillus sp. FJAT-26390]|uniref:hypothetical protein n=1 Tax=Bacillus sp. FJAT-26390 TaxID=1743142 RepID=UPI000807BB65|nr:hypothetical protein [Bacillus sp. FJAT-26390]OBZ17801.1 hypothetical protein A7975_08155 [Bacillus sp. FJAT-26390]
MTEHERIHKALAVLIDATGSCNANWVVGGSASLMLRGLPLPAKPRDLDIYCDDEDVASIYESLRAFAVDEPAISVTAMYRSTLSHFLIHGVQVELVGGFQVQAAGNLYETRVRELLIPHAEHIQLYEQECPVPIVPLAHELWFNYLRNRMDRVELIVQAFAEAPKNHEAALRAVETNNTFTAKAKENVHHLISVREAGGL